MTKTKSKGLLETELAKAQLEALKVRMNPHFIANALTSIRKMLYYDEKDAAIDYLTMFAKLMRTTLDNAAKDFITLASEIEYIGNYLEIEKLRFGIKFDTRVVVSSELKAEDILVPPTIFQPFIENSINHGLMHRTSGGVLMISFKADKNLLKCTIEDNGVGRQRSKELRSTNSLMGKTSLSEQITRDRLALYNKLYNTIDFTIETIDLEDSYGMPSGTKVEIQLPLKDIYGNGGLH
jgi:sensor histidine kinase YesM